MCRGMKRHFRRFGSSMSHDVPLPATEKSGRREASSAVATRPSTLSGPQSLGPAKSLTSAWTAALRRPGRSAIVAPMTQLVLCIAIVGVMPYVLTGIAKSRGFNAKENERTRDWQVTLTGWQKRAYWAHQNAFEAIPLFAALAILAHLRSPESQRVLEACWAFVALRFAYAACYLADAGRLRTTVWTATQVAQGVLLLVGMGVMR